MQNVRAVGFRGSVLLAAKSRGTPRPAPEAVLTLDALRFLGIRAAAIGNAPALHAAGLAKYLETILPDTAPPAALAAALELAPADILHAGTMLDADVNAALAAGMRAAWLAPAATFHPRGAAILLRQLGELPNVLRLADTARQQHARRSRIARDLVAMLRDVPDAPLAAERRHDAPAAAIGDLVLEIVTRLRTEATPIETLRANWHELVPSPLLNAGSTPERVSPGGTLAVHCQNTIVREELHRWHSRRILAQIARLPGCTAIKKINFHV